MNQKRHFWYQPEGDVSARFALQFVCFEKQKMKISRKQVSEQIDNKPGKMKFKIEFSNFSIYIMNN